MGDAVNEFYKFGGHEPNWLAFNISAGAIAVFAIIAAIMVLREWMNRY